MKAFTETDLRLLCSLVHHLRAEVLNAERLVHQAVHVAPQLVDLVAQRLDGLDQEVGDGFDVSTRAPPLGRVKTPFPGRSVRSHDRLGLRPRSQPSTA